MGARRRRNLLGSIGSGGRVSAVLPSGRRQRGWGLLSAARGVHFAACQLGDVATELRLLREQREDERRRSPIEVVLQGLTTRPKRG